MGTPQVKLSGTPSLFEVKLKLSKADGPSFADTLKPREEVLRTDVKVKNSAFKEKKVATENQKFTDHSSLKTALNKAVSEEKEVVTEKLKEELSMDSREKIHCEEEGMSSCSEEKAFFSFTKEEKDLEALFALLSGFISELSMKIGVSEEEVKKFLLENGVTLNELLDIDTWKEFTLNQNGLNEVSELLTHDRAYGNLTDISEILEKLVNSSEMKQMTAGLTEGSKDFGSSIKGFEDVLPRLLETEKGKDFLSVENHSFVSLTKVEEGFATLIPVDEVEMKDASLLQESVSSNQSQMEGGADKDSESVKGQERIILPSGNRVFENLVEVIRNLDGSDRLPEGFSARNLLDQVTDQIKMLQAPDKTTLELMLQPASLGKVLINVTSKNGVMQAELRVESPEAKQALVNNIADLKLSFENQGFKVEEIEVMLAETGIGQREEGRQPEEEKKNKSKNRKIDFSMDEGGEVQMETEEVITLNHISGSSVDYSA